MTISNLRIEKEHVSAFEEAVEKLKGSGNLTVELMETGKDGNRFYKVEADGNMFFGLGAIWQAKITEKFVKG